MNVAVKGTFIGTVSNEAGGFVLHIEQEQFTDTLLLSSIGYQSTEVLLNTLNFGQTNVFTLKPKVYELGNITISNSKISINEILKTCKREIRRNYPQHSHLLSTFYRELWLTNHKAVRLLEASLSIQQDGVKQTRERLKIRVEELRKSNDEVKYAIFDSVLHESGSYRNYLYDNLRNFDFVDLLAKSSVKELQQKYVIGIDTAGSATDNSMYVISIAPLSHPLFVTKTQIFIDTTNYAVLKSVTKTHINNEDLQYLYADKGYYYKQIRNYKEVQGSYYPSLIFVDEIVEGWQDTISHTYHRREQTFMVTNVVQPVTSEVSIKRKQREAIYGDLYKKQWPYNAAFWEHYNLMLKNPIHQNIMSELENNGKLEDQFKRNSRVRD